MMAALASTDEAALPPVAERAGDGSTRRADHARQFFLRQRQRDLDGGADSAAMLSREVEKETGKALRAAGDRPRAQHDAGIAPALRHHPPVGAVGSRVGAEERAEPVVAHNQRVHGADGLHGGIAVSGGRASGFAGNVAAAEEREDVLMTVVGHRKDLHPAIQQDEHMRGGVSLDTQGRTRRILLVPAQGHQVALLITSKQLPESAGRSHPLHVRVTVGSSDMAASR